MSEQFLQEVYVDESYDTEIFILSLCTAHPNAWRHFRLLFTSFLDETNARLLATGRTPLSRYHATDCAHKKREFAGWTDVEQIAFTRRLIQILLCCPLHCVSVCVLTKDIQSAWATTFQVRLDPNSCLRASYFVAAQVAADLLTEMVHAINPQVAFQLTYDQAPEDQMISLAIDHLQSILNSRFGSISKISSGNSRDCIPLQASDFLAYESFKERKREIDRPEMAQRKSFRALLDGGIGISLRTVKAEFITEIVSANARAFLVSE